MLKNAKTLIFSTALLMLSACGFHFQNGQLVPKELQTIALESGDQYDSMTIAMRKQLRLNNIKIVDADAGVPVLRLNKTGSTDKVASVFKQGREAEKILTVQVEASIQMPNHTVYPLNAKVNRTFFDNSRAALAKYNEREMILNDMREQAARQLISKMVAVGHKAKTDQK
ncbi:LPS assembly lipoprotein LptE [Pasteurellaceae bacterium LIM206]|nr:LPS assembly lipoprotein LptE [Pasteurellaceae bacterium LIM206]